MTKFISKGGLRWRVWTVSRRSHFLVLSLNVNTPSSPLTPTPYFGVLRKLFVVVVAPDRKQISNNRATIHETYVIRVLLAYWVQDNNKVLRLFL